MSEGQVVKVVVGCYTTTTDRGWSVTAAPVNGRVMIVCSRKHAIVTVDVLTMHTLPEYLLTAAKAVVLQLTLDMAPAPIPMGHG